MVLSQRTAAILGAVLLSCLLFSTLHDSAAPAVEYLSSSTSSTTKADPPAHPPPPPPLTPPPLDCTAAGCLPTYIVLGAGKTGTSSLYGYLSGHPSILPAVQKQVHYYKYSYSSGQKWYRAQFPPASSFSESASPPVIATGEAAPGYLPYP